MKHSLYLRSLIAAVVAAATIETAAAGISVSSLEVSTEIDLELLPDSDHVHYLEVTLEGPGYIDLSNVNFVTRRRPDSTSKRTFVEVSIIRKPSKSACPFEANPSCWMNEAGVGVPGSDGIPRWCCTEEAIESGLCEDKSYYNNDYLQKDQHQLINADRFTSFGKQWSVVFLNRCEGLNQVVDDGRVEISHGPGRFAIVFASCNEKHGEAVFINGHISFMGSGENSVSFTSLQELPNLSGAYETVEASAKEASAHGDMRPSRTSVLVLVSAGIIGITSMIACFWLFYTVLGICRQGWNKNYAAVDVSPETSL